MLLGALGDIHGDGASVRAILQRHPDVPAWLCVGDVADEAGHYEAFERPVYWIKGNNENFDAIASGELPAGLHHIPNGTAVVVAGLNVAGLGGTLAPTVFDLPAADLPHPVKRTARAAEMADRRRHFVREEVDRCKAMREVDIFLTHEAPRPFRVGPVDAGKTPINEILTAMTPRLHLFGHHHRYTDRAVQGVRSIGMDLVSRSYLLIDTATLELRLHAVN